ncbi:3-phosphoshikimate 1-carboxyvinyltransferase [Candidatus Manganitrophus noduliformans]|uniref:3-phosphoshikimate 1-carboxyvinyltransferase n=1 Tax=Candidatus Manganitrophus noduliformans TaxID=2606439 RepID=A0A7X6DSV9_9BACT|nr:3-phosphoshikimate 1-carboxyvinyltransferase [Candidatus Manganitrophus noduliformans]NKE72781.1 3-phosphoshikimate 1-carboxyvinyltransferase [Candidatus Manganitrophus noduliformans]
MTTPVKKRPLRGTITVPGDKSITHRAVIFSALGEGTSEVIGYLPSEDCERTITAFREMGIAISVETVNGLPSLHVQGKGLWGLTEPTGVIDCGNSGTTLRLLTGLLAGKPFFSVLTGDASLRKRPMRRVIDPLRSMGAEIFGRSGGNLAPLAISGKKLNGIDYRLPIASAQVKSAILLAGLTASGVTTLSEPSRSRDHTERMLRSLGVRFEENNGRLSIVGGSSYPGKRIEVPGDLSSAAFFLVAGAIIEGSEITIRKIGVNPTRTGLLEVLKEMGAEITVTPLEPMGDEPVADLTVRSTSLHGAVIGGDLIPRTIDEFPILCVAAAAAEGETVIRDAQELRVKESDRIAAMAQALRGMGITVEEFPDGMRIEGKKKWKGTFCETHGDHRIAMSMAIAGLVAEGGNEIDDVACIDTSFPGFLGLLSTLNG